MFRLFDRFSTGFSAARDCWQVLQEDKSLLALPFLSGVSCLAVLASFAAPLALLRPQFLTTLLQEGDAIRPEQVPLWFWAMLFAFYFFNYAVIYFFNAALIHCALFHFRGMPLSVTDGLHAALRRIPQILAWALVSATVGLLLRMIENANDKIGRLVSALLGTTWTVLTYFVVPVLVVERVGPLQAIGRSARILKDTWGEALGGRVGISWFLLPFWILGLCTGALGFYLLHSVPALGAALIGLTILYALVLGLVNSALETILLSALYLYATQEEVPDSMDKKVLKRAFEATS